MITQHKAELVGPNGEVLPLCSKQPRVLHPKRASWTLLDDAVTCYRCRRLLRTKEVARAREAAGRTQRKNAPNGTPLLQRLLMGAKLSSRCWQWEMLVDKKGYGLISFGRRPRFAHRLSWSVANKADPAPFHIHHLCHNPGCIRPSHLKALYPYEHILYAHRETINPFTKNAAKTHCFKGHAFTPENTYVTPDGYRSCLKCVRIRAARKQAA